jgi:hypothetical protein
VKLHAKSLDIYRDITEVQPVRHIADVRERSMRVRPRKRCGGTAGARGVMGEAHIAAGAAEAAAGTTTETRCNRRLVYPARRVTMCVHCTANSGHCIYHTMAHVQLNAPLGL